MTPNTKSPALTGWLKFGEHLAIIGAFNAFLAVIAFFGTMNGEGTINWSLLIWSASSMGVLAMLDALKQYLIATKQPAYASVVDLVKTEVAARVPVVNLPAEVQAAAQALNQVVSQAPASASQPAPTSQASAPAQVQNIDTLPLIQAVQPQQVPQPPSANA